MAAASPGSLGRSDRSTILLCEDEPLDAQRVRRALGSDPSARLELVHEVTLEATLRRLAQDDIDVVLLDLQLPDSEGVDTVLRLHEQNPAVPLIVFTMADDDETARAALAIGAQDYLVKEEINASLLRRSIRYAMERQRLAEQSRLLELRQREIEKSESLGTLCSGISFGFNTQLGTILDHCCEAIAALDASEEDAVLCHLTMIHGAALHASQMTQRLRDYVDQERAAPNEVDLPAFLVEVADVVGAIAHPGIAVRWDVPEEPAWIAVQRREVHRLLVTLVANAADAIGEAPGSISISTRLLEADERLLAGTFGCPDPRPGPYVSLRVADTGAGLGGADLRRIFDPFYTTRLAGRGLGLAGVLGILQRRGGVARVELNVPRGTVFTVLFPALREAPCPRIEGPARPDIPGRPVR